MFEIDIVATSRISFFHYTTIRFPSPYEDGTDHPQGYLLIKFPKSHTVSLVYFLDQQRFYIRKIIKNNVYAPDFPPEIQFSNLGDTPFPRLPFLPVLIEAASINDDDEIFSLIPTAYNGGTQENLIE
ncbi:hypothetical protein MMC34_003484 [Xylographa carneopallida]|nr:hypothetical protein [Xylographa carneopallida]